MTKRARTLLLIALLLAASYIHAENPEFFKKLSPKNIKQTLSVDKNYPKPNVENGDVIDLEVGETYTVKLEGNSTTGYVWDVKYNPNLLKLIRQEYVPAQGPDSVVGRGGIHEFEFVAIQDGDDNIWFYWHKPWEQDSTIRDVNITFVVR